MSQSSREKKVVQKPNIKRPLISKKSLPVEEISDEEVSDVKPVVKPVVKKVSGKKPLSKVSLSKTVTKSSGISSDKTSEDISEEPLAKKISAKKPLTKTSISKTASKKTPSDDAPSESLVKKAPGKKPGIITAGQGSKSTSETLGKEKVLSKPKPVLGKKVISGVKNISGSKKEEKKEEKPKEKASLTRTISEKKIISGTKKEEKDMEKDMEEEKPKEKPSLTRTISEKKIISGTKKEEKKEEEDIEEEKPSLTRTISEKKIISGTKKEEKKEEKKEDMEKDMEIPVGESIEKDPVKKPYVFGMINSMIRWSEISRLPSKEEDDSEKETLWTDKTPSSKPISNIININQVFLLVRFGIQIKGPCKILVKGLYNRDILEYVRVMFVQHTWIDWNTKEVDPESQYDGLIWLSGIDGDNHCVMNAEEVLKDIQKFKHSIPHMLLPFAPLSCSGKYFKWPNGYMWLSLYPNLSEQSPSDNVMPLSYVYIIGSSDLKNEMREWNLDEYRGLWKINRVGWLNDLFKSLEVDASKKKGDIISVNISSIIPTSETSDFSTSYAYWILTNYAMYINTEVDYIANVVTPLWKILNNMILKPL